MIKKLKILGKVYIRLNIYRRIGIGEVCIGFKFLWGDFFIKKRGVLVLFYKVI